VVSQKLYLALLALLVAERGLELWLARRNAARARARGGVEVGSGHFRAMALLHALFPVCCAAEVLALQRPFQPALGAAMLAMTLGAQALRYWAVRALGDAWNVRVITVPGAPAVDRGPYRYVRHPNYVAVVLEMVAVPLIHGAWLTALVFSALNAALLRVRIRSEEAALRAHTDYEARLGTRPRFVPRGVADRGR
jgi:methyltransferase